MSNVIPANFGKVSSKFAGVAIPNEAAAGIEGGYALMKYKGKVWSVDYRGEAKPIMRPDGDGPANSIEVVIVSASPVKSKIYYPNYVDGASERPVCYSTNGVSPDPRAQTKQANACAICPQNQSGSKVDEAGQARGKACRDSKRVAIVPLADMQNELYGGPMLLRIPAASLNDFAMFTRKLDQLGLPYCAVGVKISFDPSQAYPKFVFTGIRPLTDEEADIVLALRDDPQTKRIVSEEPQVQDDSFAEFAANLGTVPAKLSHLATPKAPPAAAPPATKPAPKAAPKIAVVEAPADEDVPDTTGTSLDDQLDALLG